MCTGVPLPIMKREVDLRRPVSDPHHFVNTSYPRRFFDWFTIPLCRLHHDFIDTIEGRKWERDNRERMVKAAALMLLRNGRITPERHDLLWGNLTPEGINAWIDGLIEDGQNWEGGTI